MFFDVFNWNNFYHVKSKDRLIASLKEGSGSGETMVHATELDSMRQERDIMREELQNSQMALENLRSELSVRRICPFLV